MTKDLTERRRYFIYLKDSHGTLYTTCGEYLERSGPNHWQKGATPFYIREGIDQEVPDTYCILFCGTALANTISN
jgi:hypothetical protein